MTFKTLAEQYAHNKVQHKIDSLKNLETLLIEWSHNFTLYVTNTITNGGIPQPLYLYNNEILNKSITESPEFKFKTHLQHYAFYPRFKKKTLSFKSGMNF